MADDNNLAATLTDNPSTDSGLSSALGSGTASTPTATPDSAPPQMNQPQGQPDLPRFQRTFGNTLKGILMGWAMNGVPGAIAGGISPQGIQRQANASAQATQAKITFANAQAAHEVAMAHQADVEYQALPGKLQQEAEARGLENMERAKAAGYLPVASIPLDQGTAQNSQNASTALNSIKSQFGAVPSGLLYIHTGNGVTVMKLQDPNAALPMINQARRAQGMPEITQDVFATLKPEDRDGMARNALNFTNPRDVNGMVSQQSLNEANMRLETVKAQPDFNGKSELVTQLQATVDHQKAVIDSGAVQEAQRKGSAAGTEAQAAQPGTTAAKVADIKATAGPEAAAAGAKAKAVAKGTAEGQLEGGGGPQTDILGGTYTPPAGGIKEANKVRDSFKKDADELAKTEGTFNQFQDVLNDINAGKDISGAQSVVALFNAIGISATPLKGMGMRINNNTVEEHATARGLGQSLYQKFLNLKNGDIITPQQIKDYAQIAARSRRDAYVNKINEVRSAGVDPSFLLPRGNGRPLDTNTGHIFYDTAGGGTQQEKAANAIKAAKAVGWQ
jgi:hypothetical protein